MTRRRYSVSGFLVESGVPLCGLAPSDANGFPPEYTVARMEATARDVPPEWTRAPTVSRDFIRKSEHDAASYWLRTGDAKAHRIHPAERLVELCPDSSPGLALTHGVVDFALPNLFSCRDQVVFHGALLETGTGCVAALGEAGVGKSTLAASWVRAGRRFLADDWFVLKPEGGRLVAWPSHPSIRLRWRDRELLIRGGVEEIDWQPGFSKFWYSFGAGGPAHCAEPRELRGVAFLRRTGNGTERTTLRSPGSREAMEGLVSALVLLEIDSRERWEFLLPLLRRIEAGVRMEVVNLPDVTEDMEEALAAIEGLSGPGAGEGIAAGRGAAKGADARRT